MGIRFVVVAAPRTGSNWLCARLRSQPDVWCHGEVFHPERVWVRSPDEDDPFGIAYEAELRGLRAADRGKFLDRIFDLSFGRPNVGFKIFPAHGNGEAFRIADNTAVSKIVLYRSNYLAVYSSLLAARQTGAYSAAEMVRVPRPTVSFSEEQFIEWHMTYERFYERILLRLRNSGQNFHLVQYEELNSIDRFGSLLEFLTATPEIAHTKELRVRGSSDILSRFSNPKTVEAVLRNRDLLHLAREEDVRPRE